jgi:hypothetical protein
MARLQVAGDSLEVRLSPLEMIGAAGVSRPNVALSAVREVRVSDDPWSELRGIRAPGTGVPGLIMLGSRRSRGGRDFAAVYRRRPAVVVDMEGADWGRFVVSMSDATAVADEIRAAASAASEPPGQPAPQ